MKQLGKGPVTLSEIHQAIGDVIQGGNPRTKFPAVFFWGQPAPGRSTILYQRDKAEWYYSRDAGLIWEEIVGDLRPFLDKADVLISENLVCEGVWGEWQGKERIE